MRPPVILTLILAAALPAAAQIRVDFFQHPEVRIGPYVMYAVQACNGSGEPAAIRGGNIWDQARERGRFTPQLMSVVLAEKDVGTKTSTKARILRGLSWATAGGTALTGGRVLGNLSLESGAGKAVMVIGTAVSTLSAVAAEAVAKEPERDVDPKIDAMLPGTLQLAAQDCSSLYVMWGIPLEVQP